jgi:hypothetical protein
MWLGRPANRRRSGPGGRIWLAVLLCAACAAGTSAAALALNAPGGQTAHGSHTARRRRARSESPRARHPHRSRARRTRPLITPTVRLLTMTRSLRGGRAQAFSVTASASGRARSIRIYVARPNHAVRLLVGLYASSRRHPTRRIAFGALRLSRRGAWVSVRIGSVALRAGRGYWLAVLGLGGRLAVRAGASASCSSELSAQRRLRRLPLRWRGGARAADCALAARVVGVAHVHPARSSASASTDPASTLASSPTAAAAPPPRSTPTALGAPSAAGGNRTHPPRSLSAPAISGSAQVGDVLSVSTGTWSGSPTSFAYQWQACDSSGADCSDIAGATQSTYTVQSSQVGDTLRAQVTATNAAGSASATSAPTAVITAASSTTTSGAAQVFIAQSAAGSADGSSCANALPVSWFDTPANWGTGAGQIGPGTTVGLCGTISTPLVAYGSGTSSEPITIAWQPGATLSSPDWGGGAAIATNNNNYLVFNGEGVGSIQATALGSGLADQGEHAQAFWAENCTGCTFENLLIENLYQHTSNTDTSVDQTMDNAIRFSGSDITIADNTIHDVGWALYASWNDGDSNISIYGNNIYNVDHGFVSSSGFPGGSIGPIYFYDNHIHDYANWDTTTDAYHHDGIHCYTSDGGAGPSHYDGFYIYDNRFDGAVGQDATSQIFMEGGNWSGATPCADATSKIYIFNNVITSSDQPTDNAYLTIGSSSGDVFNNTVMGATNAQMIGGCASYNAEQSGQMIAFENNLLSDCDDLMSQAGPPNGVFASGSPNYNVYADGGENAFVCGTTSGTNYFYAFSQFSSWQNCLANDTGGTATGADQNSIAVASADLNSDGSPQSGSPAIGAGANLTSLCQGQPNPGLGALCETYTGPPAGGGAGSTTPGSPRPATGSWNAGAF